MTGPKITSTEITAAHLRIAGIMGEGTEATGEQLAALDREALDLLEGLGEAAEEKLEALRAVCVRLETEAKMLQMEERLLSARRRSCSRGIERIRAYACGIITARHEAGLGTKVKTPSHTFWITRRQTLHGPEHVSAWREAGWIRTKEEPDKKAAKEALKAGAEAQGFALVETESISWR